MLLVFNVKLDMFLFKPPKFGGATGALLFEILPTAAAELLNWIKPVDRLDILGFDVGPVCVDDATGDVVELAFGVFEPIIDEPNEKLPNPKLLLLLFEAFALLESGGELAFDDGATFTVVVTLPGMVNKFGFWASCRRVAKFCKF